MANRAEREWPIHVMKAAFPSKQQVGEAFRHSLSRFAGDYSVPRDETAMCAYIADHVPDGRYAVYGAGTLGWRIFDALACRPNVDVRVFVDKRAAEIGMYCGREVVTVDCLDPGGVDGVIVAHHHRERSMIAALRRRGVPETQIFSVFTNPYFVRWFSTRLAADTGTSFDRGIRHLVISCAEPAWSLLRDTELVAMLPPEQTLHLYFGNATPLARGWLDTVYPTVDLRLSLSLLDSIVTLTKPDSVYVKVSAHHSGQFLGAYLKARFPACVVVEEMYDQALMLTDGKLIQGYGVDADDILDMRIAELAAMQMCDLILTKNGGDAWERASKGLKAPRLTYYPRITEPSCSHVGRKNDPHSLVFAGTLPVPGGDGRLVEHRDMRYVEMIKRMVPSPRLRIDLYNGADRSGEHAGLYAPYYEAFGREGAIRYHAALPFDEMTRVLPTYGFGWHIMHDGIAELVEPVSRVGVGNKFTTYLDAGLPILIDPDYEFMANLIRDYGAGLVVEPEALAGLENTLASVDQEAMRSGVDRLAAAMASSNHTVRDHLGEILKPRSPAGLSSSMAQRRN